MANASKGSSPTRVAWFPKCDDLRGNPYWPQLQTELEILGVEFETSHNSFWTTRRWLIEHRRRVDVLHFHFIQPQYAIGDRASKRRLLKFTSDLLLARALGYRIVWTMHDLVPTWPKTPRWIERLARYTIAWLADDVIVHCHEATRLLRYEFGRTRRVHVLPHPTFAGVYPNYISRSEARAQLQIPQNDFVVGFIGGVRPNKGLEDLISAFNHAELTNAVLLIAGRPWPPESYIEEVRRLVEENPKIVLRAEEIADQQLQMYINASDVLVFPFRQVLTSGSVILAMSFGRPVIVPRLGCLSELVTLHTGFQYAAGNIAELTNAVLQAASSELPEMGIAAARKVNAFTWRDLALGTMEVYRGSE